MSEQLLYVDRSRVHDGALEELKPAMTDLAEFVAANEPDILAYNVYFDEAGDRMTVVHRHAAQPSLEHHMEIAGPKFPPIGEFIDLESIDVYGRLSDDMVQRLRDKAASLGSGRVTVHDFHAGTDRVPGS